VLRAVVVARFVSLLGTNMTTVALPWFVLATTGSTKKMGLVLACQTLPAFALGIPGGSVVAALGARRALVLGDALRAPLLVSVPVLHAAGLLSFPALLALVTAIGVFSVPYAAASSSLLPELVGEDEREVARAQAALQVAIQTTGVIGPVVAGGLIPLLGAPQVLYVDGASYAASAMIVAALVRVGRAVPAEQRRRGALAGVRHVFADPLLASIVTVALVAHVALAGLFASLPALAFRSFHDARIAGVLFSADAVGSLLGGLLALRLARRFDPLRVGVAGFALMAAPIWLLVVAHDVPLAVVVLFVFGVGGPLGVSPISALLTTRAPADVRPKVVAAFLSITSAGTPLGAALTGYAIAGAGFATTYLGIAAAMTFATLLLLLGSTRLHASRLTRHLREVRRVRRLPHALRLLPLDPLEQHPQVADGVVDPGVEIADLREARRE
jgi:MFS family permease